jgi:protein-L-isoaspartate O-methyltransferase
LTTDRAAVSNTAVRSCCNPRGCDDFFGDKFARRVAKRYRKRGLDKTAGRIVAFLEREGVEAARVLEIGGGVGEIQLELLKRGAASAVNLELSAAYDAEARELLREAGIDESRVTRRLHDIAEDPDAVEPADVVVLHRVVCCYPDYERLLSAAAARAGRLLVFSHPPRNVVVRAFICVQNLGLRLSRKELRTYAHPPAAMLDVCRASGLRSTYAHAGAVWQVEGLSR